MRRTVSSLVGRKPDPLTAKPQRSVVIKNKFLLAALRKLAKQWSVQQAGKQRAITLTPPSKDTSASTYAIVIGIEYVKYANEGQMERLPGCHYDTKVMKSLLQNNLGVPSSNISVIGDRSIRVVS